MVLKSRAHCAVYIHCLQSRYVHCPWKAPPTVLARAGVVLGRNYPDRIVEDLEAARQRNYNIRTEHL